MSSPGGGTAADHHHHLIFPPPPPGGGSTAFHVPQHSRREKLRFPSDDAAALLLHHPSPAAFCGPPPHLAYQPAPQPPPNAFALSLSPPRRQPAPTAVPAAGPYGPFTGYAAVLSRSRFLAPAQKLLEEICDVGRCADRGEYLDSGFADADQDHPDHDVSWTDGGESASASGSAVEQQWRKTRLVSILEEVCKRYRQYFQQVQSVISSFESVAGLSNAAPFAAAALRAMARQFKCIKSMIATQLRHAGKAAGSGKDAPSGKEAAGGAFGLLSCGGDGTVGFPRVNGAAAGAFGQPHNVWRPQRGLPDRAVAVLRAWLFDHFLHPYPTDSDKQMLAKQTGLTRNQVSNWFINARVRLWKPMVEEIHNLEMRQLQNNPNQPDAQHPMNLSATAAAAGSGNPTDSQIGHANVLPGSNPVHELPPIPNSVNIAGNFSYDAGQQQAGNSGGVSLTLGLHQNLNPRPRIAEPLPASLVHRFGLDDVSDAYVFAHFASHDRHFAKPDLGAGHLMHDFVG